MSFDVNLDMDKIMTAAEEQLEEEPTVDIFLEILDYIEANQVSQNSIEKPVREFPTLLTLTRIAGGVSP